MLTLFATPKDFKGHFAVIQENAIASWCKLRPRPEIILLGSSFGVGQIAKKYGLLHIPKVKISKLGTPLVSDLFAKAKSASKFPIMAYVNADIIFLEDFQRGLQKIKFSKFLVVGRRFELEVNSKINFEKNWRKELSKKLNERTQVKSNKAVDYFIFPKNMNFDIPPFVIGRWVWDNWFLYQARNLKIPLIDATNSICAVHQDHDYSHAGGFEDLFLGQERKRNLQLTPDKDRSFRIDDADWVLTTKGLVRPPKNPYRYWRAIKVYPILHPRVGLLISPFLRALQFAFDRMRINLR